MYRLMFVTLIFLAWAFFELSGGTDFQPPEREARIATLSTFDDTDRPEPVTRARVPADTSGTAEAAVETVDASTIEINVPTVEDVATETAVTLASAPIETEIPLDADIRAVTGSRVNMRNGPGTNFPVLTQLVRGETAMVLQEPGNGWLKIRVQETGRVGWMSASLMRSVN